jgi:hypothetical protein
MIGQDFPGPSDEAPGRFIAGAQDHTDVRQEFIAGQSADRAGLLLELDVKQFRHDVVGRMFCSPVDVVAEHVGGFEVLRDAPRLARLGEQIGIDPVPHSLLVLFPRRLSGTTPDVCPLRWRHEHRDHPDITP